ncbi:hypothetical protein ACLOJK_027591 [Asimina triloba]
MRPRMSAIQFCITRCLLWPVVICCFGKEMDSVEAVLLLYCVRLPWPALLENGLPDLLKMGLPELFAVALLVDGFSTGGDDAAMANLGLPIGRHEG